MAESWIWLLPSRMVAGVAASHATNQSQGSQITGYWPTATFQLTNQLVWLQERHTKTHLFFKLSSDQWHGCLCKDSEIDRVIHCPNIAPASGWTRELGGQLVEFCVSLGKHLTGYSKYWKGLHWTITLSEMFCYQIIFWYIIHCLQSRGSSHKKTLYSGFLYTIVSVYRRGSAWTLVHQFFDPGMFFEGRLDSPLPTGFQPYHDFLQWPASPWGPCMWRCPKMAHWHTGGFTLANWTAGWLDTTIDKAGW